MPGPGKDGRDKVVIVKRKRGGHGHGHHGGSWKVAYADFVTAMMAFFMVMWIVGMDEAAKKSIEGYFSNPVGFKKGFGSGRNPLSSGAVPFSVSAAVPLPSRTAETQSLESVANRLAQRFEEGEVPELRGHVDITLTSEGLRIEFGEGLAGDATFGTGSAEMTLPMRAALGIVGGELRAIPNSLIIEGHTDAAPMSQGRGRYTNWELSSDRANAARRTLEELGIDPGRIAAVRGLADRVPKVRVFPGDPRNRRISILVTFRSNAPPAAPDGANAPSDAPEPPIAALPGPPSATP